MKVGIAGIGAMGAAIARRIEESKHELTVWNRSPGPCEEFAARGVAVADSPRELAEAAELVITMLADGGAVEAVAAALCEAPATDPARVWVEMSTIDAPRSAELAGRAAGVGLAYLRAPVSGNPSVVAAGNLTIIASGEEETLERAKPVLAAIGPNLFHVGAGEQARTMKLALNLMIAATNQMLAEALALGEASGLERGKMLEVMSASAVGSPFLKYKAEALAADDYTTTFSVRLLAKDLDLIIAGANAEGVPLPAAAATRQSVQSAISAGLGELDLSAMLPLLRRDAGLPGDLPGASG